VGLRIVLYIVIGIGVIVLLNYVVSQNKKNATTTSPRAVSPVRVPVSHRLWLLHGNVEVAANQMKWANFTVPEGATSTQISGEFHAFGGAGNDIQIVLTDAFDFENWKNGHPTRLFYNSDKVTNGVVAVQDLQPGQYALAFDNRFSAFSRKELTGEITLTYLLP
jgi:hypothetical protein